MQEAAASAPTRADPKAHDAGVYQESRRAGCSRCSGALVHGAQVHQHALSAAAPCSQHVAPCTLAPVAPVFLLSSLHEVPSRPTLAASVVLGCSVVAATQQPTFRSGTQTVPLYVTVTDAQGRLVPDLVKDDFQVLDNNMPQEITLFDNAVRPITAVVMLDTSGSMTMNLDLVKQAAEQFVIRLLPDDKAKVGAFNDKIEFGSAEFTNDRDELAASIRELDFGNATRLWDAVDASINELAGVDDAPRRRGVHRRRRHRQPHGPGPGHRSRPRRRGDGLRDRPRERDAARGHGPRHSHAPGSRAEASSRRRPAAATSSSRRPRSSDRRSRASRRSSTASTCSASRRKTLDGKVHRLDVRTPAKTGAQAARPAKLRRRAPRDQQHEKHEIAFDGLRARAATAPGAAEAEPSCEPCGAVLRPQEGRASARLGRFGLWSLVWSDLRRTGSSGSWKLFVAAPESVCTA